MTIDFPPAEYCAAGVEWLKHRHSTTQKTPFLQLSGHPHTLAPAGPVTIWKKACLNELTAYQALAEEDLSITAKLISHVQYGPSLFLELSNLLQGFGPCAWVMDVKMGTRTFLQIGDELPRRDLYEKMIKLSPSYPTETEHRTKSVTKSRYMQFREEKSSSARLGFRVEGVKIGESTNTSLQHLDKEKDILSLLKEFLPQASLRSELVRRLEYIEKVLGCSEFFGSHEVIGSSLLIIHDQTKLNCWMIDFAKTMVLRSDHLGPETDGYLTGLRELSRILVA